MARSTTASSSSSLVGKWAYTVTREKRAWAATAEVVACVRLFSSRSAASRIASTLRSATAWRWSFEGLEGSGLIGPEPIGRCWLGPCPPEVGRPPAEKLSAAIKAGLRAVMHRTRSAKQETPVEEGGSTPSSSVLRPSAQGCEVDHRAANEDGSDFQRSPPGGDRRQDIVIFA